MGVLRPVGSAKVMFDLSDDRLAERLHLAPYESLWILPSWNFKVAKHWMRDVLGSVSLSFGIALR